MSLKELPIYSDQSLKEDNPQSQSVLSAVAEAHLPKHPLWHSCRENFLFMKGSLYFLLSDAVQPTSVKGQLQGALLNSN
jgi:hypothetical protein